MSVSAFFRSFDKTRYSNMPMQYAVTFKDRKIDNFQMKNSDVFLIFAQNVDCTYTLEYPQSIF